MRNLRTNRAVLLDALPERRTKRWFRRFRTGDRFCEPSFKYLSPGSEGEKCRPLDHMEQIPFIHSTQYIIRGKFRVIFFPYGIFKRVMARCRFVNCARVLGARLRAIAKVLFRSLWYVPVRTGTK